jgi:hypothetical protein
MSDPGGRADGVSADRTGEAAFCVGWLRALAVATALTLGRPILWLVALAGFLARGGILLFALPIVVLPTPTGLSNVFAEDVAALALGGPAPGTIVHLGLLVGLLVVAVLLATLTGAVVEVALVEAVAVDAEVRSVMPTGRLSALARSSDRTIVARAFAVRLAALVPVGIALAWAIPRVVAATYHELLLPDELVTPIVLRVVRDAPDAPVVLLVGWLLGETIGAVAVRGVVLDGRGVIGALAGAVRLVVERPRTTLLTALGGLAIGILAMAPGLVAAAVVWSRLGVALADDAPAAAIMALTALFVAAWTGGLVLAAAASAWRSASWTVELARAAKARAHRWFVRSRSELREA